jgi:FkbM family methyltransferase
MIPSLKVFAKKILPQAICDYSIRRHDYIRLGFRPGAASRMAVTESKHRAMCDARLHLLPRSILWRLRTCVDAGAHTGSWTKALLDLFCPECVMAVECDPRLLGPLRKAMEALPCVQIVDAALSDCDGSTGFFQLSHPASSSLLSARPEITAEYAEGSWAVVGQTEVRKISYDTLVATEKEISILKLDIQGSEKSMLAGSTSGLKKTKSVIIEVPFVSHYETDACFPELHGLMSQKGFALYGMSSAYRQHSGRALWADAVYVREDVMREIADDAAACHSNCGA